MIKEDTSQDYCTFFPEGLSKDISWSHCCKVHDKAYELQVNKGQADRELYNCVKEASPEGITWIVAALMFVGVSLLGKRFYNKK